MLKITVIFLLAGCIALTAADQSAAPAHGNVPSAGSIKELLAVTEAHKLVDGTMSQMEALMQNAFRDATKGQPPSPETQKMVDQSRSEMMAIMRDELAWDKLEPIYIQIYEQSLTQEEVNGMVAFYKTPLGRAVIKKMPVVVQTTMTEMQKRMGPMMQRMQQKQRELLTQIETDKKGKR